MAIHRGTDDGTQSSEYRVELDPKAKRGDWLGRLIPIEPKTKPKEKR
jgi:hypothetical protein